jgi:regulator of replication initiation timing
MADPTPSGMEFPEMRKLDVQMLLQNLAEARREVSEERRHAERRVAEERERSKWEQEKIRKELSDRLAELERQNEALVLTLGRLQSENHRLREEVAYLRVLVNTRTNGREGPKASEGEKADSQRSSSNPFGRPSLGSIVPLNPQTAPPLGRVPIVPFGTSSPSSPSSSA